MIQMNFSKDEFSRIKVALRLRAEACAENNDYIEERKWGACLIKIELIENESDIGCIVLKKKKGGLE